MNTECAHRLLKHRGRRAVELPRHVAGRNLDDMRLQSGVAHRPRGLEPEEATADDGGATGYAGARR